MNQEMQNLLEQLLVSSILARARQVRIAWRIDEAEKTGTEVPKDKWPDDNSFVNEAVDEIKNNRKYIINRLAP